jgi:hypothetical protein
MRKLFLISILFAAVAVAAQMQKQGTKKRKLPEASIIWDGNQLHKLCQAYKGADKFPLGAGCSFYISGAAQTLVLNDDVKTSVLRQPCPSNGVTNEQIVNVVVKWLEEHPESRQLPAPYIIMESLDKAFPCE